MPVHQGRKETVSIPRGQPARDPSVSTGRTAVNPSPVTQAVTGIQYPTSSMYSASEAETRSCRTAPYRFYNHANIARSAIDDGATVTESLAAPDEDHIQQLWGQIRQQKEQKMAKERPKVESFEPLTKPHKVAAGGGHAYAGESQEIDIPVMDAPGPKLKKKKSISSFRESSDGRSMVATFDLPDVPKEDVHVSFQKNRVVITWAIAELSEWEENGIVMRERFEQVFQRMIPLPEGTKFSEVRAMMGTKQLTLRYPNMRCYKIDAIPGSGSRDS